jgi:hypothetical protein
MHSLMHLEGLQLLSPRFIDIRQRRFFRIGAVIVFLLGIGALAVRHSLEHERIGISRKHELAEAAFVAP